MHFGFRLIAATFSAAALVFCCSCEKHHLGEDPEVQKEHVDLGGGAEENSGETKEATPAPAEATSATPVEFFPESTPSP